MPKSRPVIVAALGAVLVLAAAAGAYKLRTDRQQRTAATEQLEQGIAEFHAEQYAQALRTLSAIPPDTIENWRLPYYRGSAMIMLKDYPSAARELEKALTLKDDEAHVLFALGVVYYKLGNLDLARGYFEAVLKIDPGHAEARGLIDIMAGLQRYSAEESRGEAE